MQDYKTEAAKSFPQPANQPISKITEHPSPDNPPWNNWSAVGTWIASIVFIAVFPGLFLLPYLSRQTLDFTNQEAVKNFVLTDPTAALLQIISVIPAHLCTIALAWLVVTRLRKYPARQTLGWQLNGFKIWHSVIIVVFFLALAFVLTKIFGQSENDFQKMLESSRIIAIPIAFMATFTAPIVEEVIYRGILYSSLQRRVGIFFAVVIVTLMFGLVHVPQYSKNFSPDFAALIPLFLLSLTLTLIRVRTKNLLPCVVLHTMFNAVSSILILFEAYFRGYNNQIPEQVAVILQLIN